MKSDRLNFRTPSLGFLNDVFGGDFPLWIRQLKKRSGVYVIRDIIDHKILYVGESHTGRLYETLTRHFQRWTGPTAGPTYSRASVDVAVLVRSASTAVNVQNRLICTLGPHDNDLSPGCSLKKNENPF